MENNEQNSYDENLTEDEEDDDEAADEDEESEEEDLFVPGDVVWALRR